MIDITEQVQFGRLLRALEQFNRLLGRRYRVTGGMNEEQRPRRDFVNDVIGTEVEHALRSLRWKLVNRVCRKIVSQMLRDWHDFVTRHHERLPGSSAMLSPVREHFRKPSPLLRTLMLATEFALA